MAHFPEGRCHSDPLPRQLTETPASWSERENRLEQVRKQDFSVLFKVAGVTGGDVRCSPAGKKVGADRDNGRKPSRELQLQLEAPVPGSLAY